MNIALSLNNLIDISPGVIGGKDVVDGMGDLTDSIQRSVNQSLVSIQQLYFSGFPSGSSSTTPRFSRSLQRKLESLLQCNLNDANGLLAAMHLALSLADRTVTDLIHICQTQQRVTINLWTAVRSHGCQFLGPAMQEEVLKLVLLALEDGSSLSRKVLVLFVVQRLHIQYPQASKTSVGHVVQILYRASCFNLIKRDDESSLMQLKEEFRSYEALRCQHDMQIVEISLEFGLRIGPEQWSSVLYGDSNHKSYMQSIIDKLSKRQTFIQNRDELLGIFKKSGKPREMSTGLKLQLDILAYFHQNSISKNTKASWSDLDSCMKAVLKVLSTLVMLLQQRQAHRGENNLDAQISKVKSSVHDSVFESPASAYKDSHNPTVIRSCDFELMQEQHLSTCCDANPSYEVIYSTSFSGVPNDVALPYHSDSSFGSTMSSVHLESQISPMPIHLLSDNGVSTLNLGSFLPSPFSAPFHLFHNGSTSDSVQLLDPPNLTGGHSSSFFNQQSFHGNLSNGQQL